MSADERRYFSMRRRTPVYSFSGCWKFKMKRIHVCLSVIICYVLNGEGVLIFVSIISRSNLCTTEPFNLQADLLLHPKYKHLIG